MALIYVCGKTKIFFMIPSVASVYRVKNANEGIGNLRLSGVGPGVGEVGTDAWPPCPGRAKTDLVLRACDSCSCRRKSTSTFGRVKAVLRDVKKARAQILSIRSLLFCCISFFDRPKELLRAEPKT
jgi:hypothetical protein